LALLFASRRWDAPEYERNAQSLLDGIWNHDTMETAGQHVVASTDASGADVWSVAPDAYHVFASADPRHPWADLVASSYELLLTAPPADGEQVTAASSRLLWHAALDRLWFGEKRAQALLERTGFPQPQLEVDTPQPMAPYAGPLAAVLARGDRDTASQLFAARVLQPYVDPAAGALRADPDDPTGNSRAWLVAALFDGGLSNLWDDQTTINWDTLRY
jgi:hypothetical protein